MHGTSSEDAIGSKPTVHAEKVGRGYTKGAAANRVRLGKHPEVVRSETGHDMQVPMPLEKVE